MINRTEVTWRGLTIVVLMTSTLVFGLTPRLTQAVDADTLYVRLHLLGLAVATTNAIEMDQLSEHDAEAVGALIRSAQDDLYQAHATGDTELHRKVERKIRTASDLLLRLKATQPCVCPAQVAKFK